MHSSLWMQLAGSSMPISAVLFPPQPSLSEKEQNIWTLSDCCKELFVYKLMKTLILSHQSSWELAANFMILNLFLVLIVLIFMKTWFESYYMDKMREKCIITVLIVFILHLPGGSSWCYQQHSGWLYDSSVNFYTFGWCEAACSVIEINGFNYQVKCSMGIEELDFPSGGQVQGRDIYGAYSIIISKSHLW